MEKVKFQLQTIHELYKQIQDIKKKMQELNESAYNISAITNSDTPKRQRNNTHASFEKLIDKKISLQDKLNEKILEYIQTRFEVVQKIQKIDNVMYAEVLYKRYMQFKKFKAIAKELKADYGYIRAVHPKAVKEFEEVIRV